MGLSSTCARYEKSRANRARPDSEDVEIKDQDDDHRVDRHAEENDDVGRAFPGKFHTPESIPRVVACPSAAGPWRVNGGGGEGGPVMTGKPSEKERFPWVGPVLFTAVLALVVAFFWWFVQA